MNETMLNVENLEVYYGGIHALHDISLHVKTGEIVAIIGANGAGKSTLLKSIAGDKKRESGLLTFLGEPLETKAHRVVNQGISLVPEGRRLFPKLTVEENLMLGAYLRKDKAEIKEDIEDVVRLFPRLGERIKQYAGTLSGGEQQMVAVGRALMARPKLLCLDEPSLGLAPNIQDEMFDKLNELNKKRNQTILLVEQNAYIALEYADRAYVIDVGRIIREGTGQELLNDTFIQKSYLGVDAE